VEVGKGWRGGAEAKGGRECKCIHNRFADSISPPPSSLHSRVWRLNNLPQAKHTLTHAKSQPSILLNYPSLIFIQITSQDLPLAPREPVILSVGQFRPEKDHPLQIRAFARFLNSSSSSTGKKGHTTNKDIKLVLLGSCRGAEDERRVEVLRALAAEAGVGGQVEFVVGAPFPELKRWLGRASVGVHTMWNEHFGIVLVEYLAAAVVPGE